MKTIVNSVGIFVLILTACSFTTTSNKEVEIKDTDGFALVQLFTSQGCSSCPRADKLLNEVKKDYGNKNVYVLSYHVDYWNRLGWRDPFSKKAYTNLQYKYGGKFGEGRVYTPQAVINGSLHFVGSNEQKMNTNLSRFLNDKAANSVYLTEVNSDAKQLDLKFNVAGGITDKSLVLAMVINKRSTSVNRGENRGRTIENSNIVVEEITLPLAESLGSAKILIPEIVKNSDELSIIAYVQDASLQITGATSAEIN